jgi:EAL and modified HD-GYP domain-containing signal transduction protein
MNTKQQAPCFLSLRPVFNRDRDIYAHVAAYACFGELGGPDAGMVGFSWLVSDGMKELEKLSGKGAKLFIPLPQEAVNLPEVGRLPWENTVLMVTLGAAHGEDFIEDCRAIKTSGYGLGLRFAGPPEDEPALWDLADVIALDFSSMTTAELVLLRKRLREYPGLLMAANLKTWEAFSGAMDLGADLFQGPFFGRPEIVAGQELQAGLWSRMELMRVLQTDDYTFKDVAAVLAKDAFLTYRLLRYVNSPSLGLGRGVKSIEHAVALLGFESFKLWATTALVASLDASPKGEALAYFSLLRGQFLQTLAGQVQGCPFEPKGMFLLGLFSHLDALMGRPMRTLLTGIPMDRSMQEALCGKKNPAQPWLELLDAVDENNWDQVGGFFTARGVSLALAARAYLDASRWARVCFDAGREDPM